MNLNLLRNVEVRGPKKDPAVSRIFNRFESERPDLPVEAILDMVAFHFQTSRNEIVRRLGG